MNDLFIYAGSSDDCISLGIGSRSSKRVKTLSNGDALRLAYRLMSLARGGETRGFEKFEQRQ